MHGVLLPAASPPQTLEALLARATGLAGRQIDELAAAHGLPLPAEPRRAKGYIGRLVERALGECQKTKHDITDFPHLGVELKTLPVDSQGRPRESTFVCHVHLGDIVDCPWERSRVREKLACVLFVPIESDRGLAFETRRIGLPFLFRPSVEQQALLQADFDDLVGRLGRGEVESVTGHLGAALQLRPKAANGRARTRANDADGAPLWAMPRAFYLRPSFTEALVQQALSEQR